MEKQLQTTLADAIAFLENHSVAYALIGGIAASVRGRMRTTVDVDMVIRCDVHGALALLQRLKGSEFEPLFPGVKEVVERAFILPLRHQATGVKLDLALGISGFEQQVVSRASIVEIGGSMVHVATAEDLLLLKILAGRPQDEQDLRGLVQVIGGDLDWQYCTTVAQQLEEALGQELVKQVRKWKELSLAR